MSFSSNGNEEMEVETLFEQLEMESSEEPPMDEWSSLPSHESIIDPPKLAAYKLGKYDPGSGEICAGYVVTSDSSVRRHVYYHYPSVKDPGIMEALTFPEPKSVYDDNGQDLYLDLCEEMNVIPVKKFHRSLLQKEINLRYYGVNPVSIRAMTLSLACNKFVKRLDLTSNFLTDDACYHLGQLLEENYVLDELVLAQCRIGPSGIQRIVRHLRLRTMEVLDLSSNEIGDEGFQYLARMIEIGAVIKRLNLSHNRLGTSSCKLLTTALECNNQMTHLNLSWNHLYDTRRCDALMGLLRQNEYLVELDFSWNSMTISGGRLQELVGTKNLKLLNLSNNCLGRSSAKSLSTGLLKAKNLKTLDLSYNPMSPKDALLLLGPLANRKVGLENLLMAGILVSKGFREVLEEIKKLPFRKALNVTYERVERDYVLPSRNMRIIVLNRLDYIFARSSKKCAVDIGLYFMSELKEHPEEDFLMENAFVRFMKSNNLKADENLINQLVTLFPGPTFEKAGRAMKLSTIIEYVHRIWPDKKLPPTPPPAPPLPQATAPKKKSKEKASKPKK